MAKYKIVDIEWGNNKKCLKNKIYYNTSPELRWGLNIGSEFSNITKNCQKQIHMGIILLENRETILAAPITTGYKFKNKNLEELSEEELKELENKPNVFLLRPQRQQNDITNSINMISVIRLDKITELDKSRIIKHKFFLDDRFRKALLRKLGKLFGIIK